MYTNFSVMYYGNLLVGESPVWDERTEKLYFTDIRGKCFYEMDKNGQIEKHDVPQLLGCLALCENGDLLLGMEDGIYLYRTAEGVIEPAHAKVEIKGDRFNDGKVGPDGCYYVGTAGENFSGAFYRLAGGELTELFDGCGCSNGLDWTPNGKTLFYCDSKAHKLEKFDFSTEKHTLSNRKTVMDIPEDFGVGDGLSVDSRGDVWLAIWGGSCILHIDGKKGSIIDKIELPASQISSCCFAGTDLKDLIITSAAVRLDIKDEPRAGNIFRLRACVPGQQFYRYK